jgi:hypothetical protein
MNTFGLCFSFMIPGAIIGFMAGWVAKEKALRRGNVKKAKPKLFVHSLRDGE